MFARVLYSRNPVLRFAVEEIMEQLYSGLFAMKQIENYDLAILTIDPHIYIYNEEVIDILDTFLGKNKWIAFHSISSFANEKTINNGVTALFLKFERKGSFEIFKKDKVLSNYKKALEETTSFLSNSSSDSVNIIISTFKEGRIGAFIEGLSEKLKKYPNLVGGVASGTYRRGKFINFLYTSEGIIKEGFIILRLNNFTYSFGIALGHHVMGPIYEITKAEGNKIYEINNEPIVEIIQRLSRGVEDKLPYIFYYSPIAIIDNANEGLVEIVRSFKDVSEEYVDFYGPIKTGWHFRFTFAFKEEILNASIEEAIKVKKALGKIDLALDFSCLHRKFVLEDLYDREPKEYASILNAPLFGFFTLGEIGPDKKLKSLKYYNQTSIILGLREL
jgi:hypothetical protein